MDPLARFCSFYETFSAAWLDRLPELYAPRFVVEDPFRRITDHAMLRAYFERILRALHESRFVVEDVATGGDGSYVRWRWEWRPRARAPLHVVPGVTHVRFDADGRVTTHRDLFDAASGVYETVPALGTLMRAIKRRV